MSRRRIGARQEEAHMRAPVRHTPTRTLGIALVFAAVAVGLLIVLAGSAAAQGTPPTKAEGGWYRCGSEDIALVFLNPDLQIQPDGWVHASGTFFIQFQARGERALEIEKFTFSFGKEIPGEIQDCGTPEWITGAYIKNYRSDNSWADGFFVPINTYNVGDGDYAAAVSAYDANGNELVRYFTHAKVENGGRLHSQAPWPVSDFTQPWPMILPGDGDLPDGESGLFIEIAEPIAEIKAWINNVPIKLDEVEGIPRDDDVIPDLCPPGTAPSAQCESQVQSRVWGPRFTWSGKVKDEDIVKVRVTDKWGNIAEKVVHIGDPTIGGRVSIGTPEFELRMDKTRKVADANGTAVFNVTYVMKNNEYLHGDVYLRAAGDRPVASGLNGKLSPNHVMMAPNEELAGSVTISADSSLNPGDYPLTLIVEYLSGESRARKMVNFTYTLEDVAAGGPKNEEYASKAGVEAENFRGSKNDGKTVAAKEFPKEEETPAPGVFAIIAIGTLAAFARRRRV